MSNVSDLPSGTGNDDALSLDEAVSRLVASETGNSPADADQDEDEETNEDGELQDDAGDDDPSDDEEAQEDDEDASSDEDEESDEPEEPQGKGRFASDDAKVVLEDGTTISVAELKRNNLFQRDYSRKTAELSEQRKSFEADAARVRQTDAELAQHREQLSAFAKNFVPEEPSPDLLRTDPVGYFEAKADYDARVKQVQGIFAQTEQARQRQEQEARAEQEKRRTEEASRLKEVMPELSDPERYSKFMQTAQATMTGQYGLSGEEFERMAGDHRFYLMSRDLAAYQRIKSNTGKAREKAEGKPQMMKPAVRKSRDAVAAENRTAAVDRLRKTGSLNDGVAALLALQKAR